tara:strand:- start:376 stop:594 length:219 start_codon:yes stop_codon:yes gene_type:complete
MQTITTESSAVNSLQVDPDTCEAKVEFVNGNKYDYFNVSEYAIRRLLDTPNQSIGAWVNNNLVNADTQFEYA